MFILIYLIWVLVLIPVFLPLHLETGPAGQERKNYEEGFQAFIGNCSAALC
jgi:hypothetical protein